MDTETKTLSRAGLIILMAGQLLPLIDFSIVNVALASIAESLDASHLQLELMVAAYGVGFAVCLAMGGRLGDNFGRRRLFIMGVWVFGIASLACGLSSSITGLLIARVAQGVGAAMIVPQILATIHVTLTGKRHSFAIGSYGAVGGLAFVLGQVLGGFLVSADVAGLGWRSVFLINIPVCIGILICARIWVPESRSEHPANVDWTGTFVLAAALLCLLIPVALGPEYHWSWPFLTMLVCVIPLLYLLWKVELQKEKNGRFPLMPPRLLRLHSIQFGIILAVLMFSSWSGFMFSVALTFQSGLGKSPLESGNAFIMLGLSFFIGSLYSARISDRIGKLNTLFLGCALQMPALLTLAWTFYHFWPNIGVTTLLPTTFFIGVGQAFIVGSFFRIGLSEVSKKDAGASSAMLTTVQQAAFGFGSALLGTILYQTFEMTQSHQTAIATVLIAEFGLMLALVIAGLFYRRRLHNL
ncbi:MFS transporter [Marinomonas primoryensis]|jgi:MFS family permease|uniref:MFS transporter n=2 Tax=Gammaproteobacteria TaxID=1236 RepID=A0A859CSU9_9GAMM|nr:MFS transporter [Marinomonas primoryensis]QKK79275.1 major facilitator superfamily transporter [Marinomonas primoryensis]|tara:strand:+ start:28757 stop:30163 length:1407 start_codon:yes stop_codon:yes gene_type:complete